MKKYIFKTLFISSFIIFGIIIGNYKIFPYSLVKKIFRSTIYDLIYNLDTNVDERIWRHSWDSNIFYNENDCIYFEGNSFQAIIDNKDQVPDLKSIYWDTTTIYGRWSIGIYQGQSVFNLSEPVKIINPVITASDVSDCDAYFVADPFLFYTDSVKYLFFEVWNKASSHGDIAYAESKDFINWSYKSIIIDEKFHLSYPYIFSWKNENYMIPESNNDLSVRLYKAISFPDNWEYIGNLLSGYNYVDPSIFRHKNKWWMFVYTKNNQQNYLNLFYSDALIKGWTPHPKNPIIRNDLSQSRPGGRVIIIDEKIYRIAQNGIPSYGTEVNAFEIIELSDTNYLEKKTIKNPIVKKGESPWNSFGMHHVDAHFINGKWVAAVDGRND